MDSLIEDKPMFLDLNPSVEDQLKELVEKGITNYEQIKVLYDKQHELIYDLYVSGRSDFCLSIGMDKKFDFDEIVQSYIELIQYDYYRACGYDVSNYGSIPSDVVLNFSLAIVTLLKDETSLTTRIINELKNKISSERT